MTGQTIIFYEMEESGWSKSITEEGHSPPSNSIHELFLFGR